MTLLKGEPQPLEGKVKMELTVIGSRVQLWGLKMQLNCYNVYILFTGSTIPISFRAPYSTWHLFGKQRYLAAFA